MVTVLAGVATTLNCKSVTPDYPADPVKTGFLLAPSLNEKHEKGKLLFFQIKAFYL